MATGSAKSRARRTSSKASSSGSSSSSKANRNYSANLADGRSVTVRDGVKTYNSGPLQVRGNNGISISGQSYSRDKGGTGFSNSPITSEMMNPKGQINIPPIAPVTGVPDVAALNSGLVNEASGVSVGPNGQLSVAEPVDKYANLTNTQNAFQQAMQNLSAEAPSAASIQRQLERETGLRGKQQAVNDYSAQINTIVANRDANILRVEGQGRGIPEAIIGGQQAQINKEAAIAALPVQAQLAAAQGNLQLAQDHINTWGTILIQDATNKYNQKKDLLTSARDFAIGIESKRIDDLNAANERRYQESKELTTAKASAMAKVLGQGGSPSLVQAINAATDIAGVVEATGKYNGDLLAQEAQRANIEQSRASTANSYDAIRDRKDRLALDLQKFTEADKEVAAKVKTESAAKGDKALGMLKSIDELLTHPGFGAAVGPNLLARMEYNPLAGGVFAGVFSGDKSDFGSEVDMLANTLTLENMALLKGPATDKDVEIVANSMSKLKNMDVSEEAYTSELNRLRAAAQRIVDEVGITPEQASFYYGADTNEIDSLWGGPSQSILQVSTSY